MLNDSYEIITPTFHETGEGYAYRLHRLNHETHCAIKPVFDSGNRIVWNRHQGGVVLTWPELMALLDALAPLLQDFHPCARCDHLAGPGHELCPACENDDRIYTQARESEELQP